jgi:hypothetical protein
MRQPVALDGVFEGLRDGLLSHHIFEDLRPPLAGQYLIAHGQPDGKVT